MFLKITYIKKLPRLLVLCLLLLAAINCSENENTGPQNSDQINTVVSILPQKYMVERIGGELVNVEVLVGPGQSPVTYDPTPKQMTFLAEADIYFQIGVPFEALFLKRAESVLEKTRQVKTQAGIKLRSVEHHSHAGEHHAHDESETDGLADPHIWLSPKLMKVQAMNILTALSEIKPTKKALFKTNYDKFINELDSLDSHIDEMLSPFTGDTVFVFHPSYGYFTDDYALEQVTLEPSGKEADAAHLAELMTSLSGKEKLTLFVQKQFAAGMAETVAEAVDAKVVILDPLAENYFDNLLDIATKIKTALEQSRLSNSEGLE